MLYGVPMFFYSWTQRRASQLSEMIDDDDEDCMEGYISRGAASPNGDEQQQQQQQDDSNTWDELLKKAVNDAQQPSTVQQRLRDDVSSTQAESDVSSDCSFLQAWERMISQKQKQQQDRAADMEPHHTEVVNSTDTNACADDVEGMTDAADFEQELPTIPFVSLDLRSQGAENIDEDDADGFDYDAYFSAACSSPIHSVTASEDIVDMVARAVASSALLRDDEHEMEDRDDEDDLASFFQLEDDVEFDELFPDCVGTPYQREFLEDNSNVVEQNEDQQIEQSVGSAYLHAAPVYVPPRVPVPRQISFQSDEFSSNSGDNEIVDPVDPLIHGRIGDNEYLADISNQLHKIILSRLRSTTDPDIMASEADRRLITRQAIDLIREHPMCCQIKYILPDFDSPCYPLVFFSAMSHLELIKAAYYAYPEAIGQEDPYTGFLPLHYACEYEASFEVIEFLVHRYPEAVRVTNQDHQTPLHLVCCCCCSTEYADYQAVIQLLLDQYPTAAQLADCEGFTPLHRACQNGARVEILQELCKQSHDEDSGSRLQSNPSSIVRAATRDMARPLHIAALFGSDVSVIDWLLRSDPASAHATTNSFDTPLHFAAAAAGVAVDCRSTLDVIQMLLSANPSAVTATNDMGETPLAVALRVGVPANSQVAALLTPPAVRSS